MRKQREELTKDWEMLGRWPVSLTRPLTEEEKRILAEDVLDVPGRELTPGRRSGNLKSRNNRR